MSQALTWALDVALATSLSLTAWRLGALTGTGAAAATVVGTVALAAGWGWALVLAVYFVTSSVLSRFRAREKTARTAGRVAKHGPRDWAQVVANGGMFTLAAAGHLISPDAVWQALASGALAASAADTWATEIGTLSRASPRSILDWSPVAVGTSGGVTLLGLAAGVGGATAVAVTTRLAAWPTIAVVAALVGGMGGCLLDSVLGAAWQARRWCATCCAATERAVHTCGSTTTITGGMRWLNNDGVNAISTIGGALFGASGASYASHMR